MPRQLPPFAAIRSFEATARLGQQTLAARELGVSTSAVNHQIRALEDYLGTTLFKKSGKRTVLTSEGQNLLVPLTGALNQLEVIFSNYPNRSGMRLLKIQCYKPFANLWLMPQLGNFAKKHPDVPLSVISSSKRPSEDDVDLAVIYARTKPKQERCDLLFNEVTTPVCAPSMLHAERNKPAPKDLKKARLISSIKYTSAWKDWMTAAGLEDFTANPALVVDDLSTGLQAAISGVGWAMDMAPLGEWYKSQGVLVAPFDIVHETGYSYFLVISRRCINLEHALIFREWLLSLCEVQQNAMSGK
ncbi:MAG: LysR substrate-binding domain-containing protein [Boseongicola sp.]